MEMESSGNRGDDGVSTRGWIEGHVVSERPLSRRERQIHQLIQSGLSRKEVAFELKLSDATVRVLYARAMKKLGHLWRPRPPEAPAAVATV
jgi:DNA-binding NarL/FixJ family response regulator